MGRGFSLSLRPTPVKSVFTLQHLHQEGPLPCVIAYCPSLDCVSEYCFLLLIVFAFVSFLFFFLGGGELAVISCFEVAWHVVFAA